MTFTTIGMIVLAVIAIAFVLWHPQTENKKNKGKQQTVQELLSYKDISPDGIIELPGNKYRLVLEVQPINMQLKSPDEQNAIWLGFRSLLNSLTLPVSFVVQTRYMDLTNYISELATLAKQLPTPELKDYSRDLVSYLKNRTETSARDKRYYVIIKIDTSDLASIDSGVVVENEMINSLIRNLKKQSLTATEAKDLAYRELENMAEVIAQGLNNIGLEVHRLGRSGVLELIYTTFNRDMAPVVRIAQADAAGMFNLSPGTITPILAQQEGGE